MSHPQSAQGIDHLVDPDIHPQPNRRQVQGFGHRLIKWHLTPEALVVVLWPPGLAALIAQRQRLIAQRCRQVIPLQQTGQIDGRFDERADRAPGIQRPVETGVANIPPAHQRRDLAGTPVGDHHGPLQIGFLALFFNLFELSGDCQFGGLLGYRIQTGEDLEPGLIEEAVTKLLLQLALELAHEGWRTTIAHLPTLQQRQGFGQVGLVLRRLNLQVVEQHPQHQIAPLLGPIRITPGIVIGGATHHANQERHLILIQLVEWQTEIEVGG